MTFPIPLALPMRLPRPLPALALPLLLPLAGCGSGTALLASSGSSSSSNASPTVAGQVTLFGTRTSPAVVRFELLDPESDRTDVRVLVRPAAGGDFRPATLVAGDYVAADGGTGQADTRLGDLRTSPGGREHFKLWDFAADDLGVDGREAVVVRVETVGGGAAESSSASPLTVGNDAPVGVLTAPSGVLSGIALLELRITDSEPEEEVLVEVQFREAPGGAPGSPDCWLTARRAGSGGDDAVDTTADGEVEDFFWDTDFDLVDDDALCIDLDGRAADVELRLVVTELPASPQDVGEVVVTEPVLVRVDNNSDPEATFENDLFVINPDGRRGIPVPFTVQDDEGHAVDVAIQWRRESEAFPPLPGIDQAGGVEELRSLLRDAARADERRALQIAGELPLWFGGRLGALPPGLDPARALRLPELGSTALPLAAAGLVGREVDVLRPHRLPRPVDLPAGVALQSPRDVASLDGADGRVLAVLDGNAAGWSLWRLRLDPGPAEVPLELLHAGAGAPRALSLGPGGGRAFVAAEGELTLLDLESGAAVASVPIAGELRGLAAASSGHALAVVRPGAGSDTELWRVDLTDPAAPAVSTLLEGLDDAHGIALDPLVDGRAYLAETGADRILTLDLATLERRPLPALAPGGGPGLEQPRSLAVEPGGRLLVTTVAGAELRLTALDLRAALDGDGDGDADPVAYSLGRLAGLADLEARLATGPGGLRLATLPGSGELAVGGGVLARRAVEAYESSRCVVTLDGADLPELPAGAPWRMARRLGAPRSSPTGAKNVFLWDSSEVAGGGRVRLRIVALDSDIGDVSEGLSSKTVRAPLNNGSPQVAAVSAGDAQTRALAAGDLDGDGDVDLVSVEFDTTGATAWHAHYQDWQLDPDLGRARTVFRSEVGGAATLDRPRGIAVADVDGDGRADVVVADTGNNALVVYRQQAGGGFTPSTLDAPGGPWRVVPADVDADGALDLVTGCRNDLRVFWGAGDGSFPTELRLDQDERRARGLAVGDVDGDGLLDLVSANEFTGTVSIFAGRGDRQFADLLELELLPGDPDVRPDGLALADLDRDGDLDLAVACTALDALVLLEQVPGGAGAPAFAAPVTLGDTNSTSQVTDLAAADLDRDGLLDLVTVNENGVQRSLTIFYRRPGAGLAFELDPNGSFNAVADSFQPLAVLVEDLDGNGGPDLCFADEGLEVVVYLEERLGVFTPDPAGPLSDPLVETNPFALVAGDVDRDGSKDLIAANLETDSVSIFLQEAPGIFDSASFVLEDPAGALLVEPVAIEFTDVDGDGIGDVVVAARGDGGLASSGNLALFYGAPDGGFEPLVLPGGPADVVRPGGVRVRDLDGDGDRDLIFVSTPSVDPPQAPPPSTIAAYEQIAPRQFAPLRVLVEGEDFVTGLQLDDVDADGRLDLVYLGRCLRRAVLRRGVEGPFGSLADPVLFGQDTLVYGSFAGGPGAPDLWMPSGLILEDLDGDGDLDVAATSNQYRVASNTCALGADEDRHGIVVFHQDLAAHPATAGFGAAPDLVLDGPEFPEVPRVPRPVDFDLDGDLDLVSSAQFEVTTFVQLRPDAFALQQVLLPTVDAGSYNSLVTEDLDGDGDEDLAVASFRLDFVRVLFGNH